MRIPMHRRCGIALLAVLAALASGCATPPREAPRTFEAPEPRVGRVSVSPGEALAHSALALLGAPYRFGGSTPQGFDCSGLVFYLHERTGVIVPRTAHSQRHAARPVTPDALAPGDLVFFRMSGRKVDHVGVYVGQRRFVHAPRRARPVSLESLDDPFYRSRFISAGRFWKP
jgi:cell wall-associated NlpC family hydrolase